MVQEIASIFLKGCNLEKMWLAAIITGIYDSMILQQCVSHQADHTSSS